MIIPKPIRKFVALFRGDVAPAIILLSVMLGFWFGLTPGWYGIHVALLVVCLILNTHMGTVILSAALGKALCYAAAPLWFYVGQFAQTHLTPLFDGLAALPVVGITDFGRCAVAGATIAGPVLGLLLGLVLAGAVRSFRRGWLRLDEGSELFRRFQQKSWVRWLDWLLLGKRAKDVRTALQQRPKFIRVAGVAVAAVVIAASATGVYFVQGDRLAGLVAQQLTNANGAEVTLGKFDLAVFGGRVSAEDIRVTDPQHPARDRVHIAGLTADAGLWSLLCGRIVVDDVALAGVKFDVPREKPGKVLVPPAAQAAPTEFNPAQFNLAKLDVAQLADYFRQGQDLTKKLAEAAEWLPESQPEPPPPPKPQRYLEYLTARATLSPTPLILVHRAQLDDVQLDFEQFGRSTITCTNLSDAPAAAGVPVTVSIQSKERPTKIEITCRFGPAGGSAEITGTLPDVDLKKLQAELNPQNPVQLEAGTATAEVSGTATRRDLDLRLAVETKNLRASTTGGGLFGLDPQVSSEALKLLASLKTTLRVVGPVRAPRLAFDVDGLRAEFKTALVQAGKRELVARLDAALGDKLPAGVPGVEQVTQDPLKTGQEALQGFLGGQNKPDPKKKKK